jgi:hypothetical protein
VGAKRGRLLINGMPAKFGLFTSGHQQDIPETALWRATNVCADIDGVTMKRPSLHQWGQTLKQPNMAATSSTITTINDLIESVGTLVAVDGSSGAITTNLDRSYLQFNVPVSSGSETYLYYQPGTSSQSEWGFRVSLQGKNLPAYTAAGTTANSLAFRVRSGAGTGKEFVLWSGGLYFKRASDSQYELIPGTTLLGLGAWKTVEVRCDTGAGGTRVYVDDTLVASYTSSVLASVSLTSGALYEIAVRVEGTGNPNTSYNARFALPMYNDDADDPFVAEEVVATTDFTFVTNSGSTQTVVLAAAGDFIYVDRMEQTWRPLVAKQRSAVFFTTYQRTLIWSDNDGGKQATIWQWDGLTDPAPLDDAPNFVLMTEHQQRLFGVDRDNPLLLLGSGDRKPNVYMDPDNLGPEDQLFDTLVDAVAIPIPAKKGDAITCIWGDYYGSLIIWTRTSIWRLTGNGVFSYTLTNISQSAGCPNANSVAMVGNDLMFNTFYGVASLKSTDQFGDVQVQMPSVAIQGMWQEGSRAPYTVNRELLGQARLAYHRTRSLLYASFFIAGQLRIMAYNTATQQWYGPWDIESTALASMELSSPRTEVIMHGSSNGKVAYTDFVRRSDYDTTAYEASWEFAMLNGRSVDPNLVGMIKTWRLLRIYFLPRGKFDYTVNWYSAVDEEFRSVTLNQCDGFQAYTVGEDFRCDVTPDGLVYGSEEIKIAEIDLDVRGYSLDFNINDSGLGQDLCILGWQVEFDADGYEVD